MILASTTFGTNMTFVLGLKTLILASMALVMVSGGCKEEEKGEKEKDQKKKAINYYMVNNHFSLKLLWNNFLTLQG